MKTKASDGADKNIFNVYINYENYLIYSLAAFMRQVCK